MTSRRTLRTAWFVLPAALFVGLLAAATLRQTGPPGRGDPAPDFSAPLLEGGGELSLGDLSDKPVVLNFWASWCRPCDDEAPLLRRAHERYGSSIAFLGVNAKDGLNDALAKLREWRLGYPSVRDSGDIYEAYGLTGQPETFFIAADGRIVEHVQGPLFADDLFALLAMLEGSAR